MEGWGRGGGGARAPVRTLICSGPPTVTWRGKRGMGRGKLFRFLFFRHYDEEWAVMYALGGGGRWEGGAHARKMCGFWPVFRGIRLH